MNTKIFLYQSDPRSMVEMIELMGYKNKVHFRLLDSIEEMRSALTPDEMQLLITGSLMGVQNPEHELRLIGRLTEYKRKNNRLAIVSYSGFYLDGPFDAYIDKCSPMAATVLQLLFKGVLGK